MALSSTDASSTTKKSPGISNKQHLSTAIHTLYESDRLIFNRETLLPVDYVMLVVVTGNYWLSRRMAHGDKSACNNIEVSLANSEPSRSCSQTDLTYLGKTTWNPTGNEVTPINRSK